jgi:hypothetical protein
MPTFITEKQQRLLNRLLAKNDIDTANRDEVHRFLGELAKREIKSAKDLTIDEASEIIDWLNEAVVEAQAENETPPPVQVAVSRVARDIAKTGVGKTGVNTDQHYQFRGIDDLVNGLSPVLARHGVTIVPKVRSYENTTHPTRSGGTQMATTLVVDWRIIGPLGDKIKATTVGLGMDTSDKSANKAMTAAYKYLLGQVFAVPFVGFDEADLTSPELGNAVSPDDQRTLNEALLVKLRGYAADQGLSVEQFTTKFRHEHGDMTIGQFEAMPRDRLFAFVREVEAYIAKQAQAAAAPVQGEPSQGS